MTIGTTNYPGSLDTVNELIQAVNRASSLLSSTIDDAIDEITVDDATLAPGSGVIWIDAEAISFTGKLGNTLTGCVRGFDNTTPAAHTNGTTVYFDIIGAAYHNTLASTIIAIETLLGADGGNVVRRDTASHQTMIGSLAIEAELAVRATVPPLTFDRYAASSSGASLIGRKSRNATLNAHTIVVDGDVLTQWEGHGSDGSAFIQGSRIRQRVNGTPSTGIIPSKIDFDTATAAGVLTTRMTIFNNGKIQMYGDVTPQLEIQNTGATQNVLIWLNNTGTGFAEFATDWWGIGEGTDAQNEAFYLWNYSDSQYIFKVDKVTSKTTFEKALAVSCDDDPQLDIVGLTGHARIRLIRGDSGYDASVTTHDWDFGENGSEEFYIWDSVNSRYVLRINQSSGLITLRGPSVWLGDGASGDHLLTIDAPAASAAYISFAEDGLSIWEMGRNAFAEFFISDPQTGPIFTIDYTTGTSYIWGGLEAAGLTAVDLADWTKKAEFDVSGISASTTRIFAVPNASGTLALTSNVQVTLGPFFINDKGAGSTEEMQLAYFNTGTALNLGTTGASSENDLRMPVAGRVVAMFLNTDSARTGGTATGRLRINNVDTGFASGACVLNSTDTIRASAFDVTGPAFAAGDRVGMGVVATAGWTPTSANLTGFIVVRFDA